MDHRTTHDLAPSIRRPTRRPAFDRDGFLVEGERWSAALAEELARDEGLDRLGQTHWAVIRRVRERYFALGSLPVMRLVCRDAGLDPQRAHRLFPGCRSLWRIAGLPHPGDEALAYMH